MKTRKLRLDPEALRVDTFTTEREDGGRGTVKAHGYTQPGYPSCDPTCGATPPEDPSICIAGTRVGCGGDTVLYCCV